MIFAELKFKRVLESAYQDFHSHNYREKDPVSLAHRYRDRKDREVAAFLSSLLSYGNVRTILASASRVLEALGPSPYDALIDDRLESRLKTFKHRFTTGADLEVVCARLGAVLREFGSVEEFFVHDAPAGSDMKGLLSNFVDRFNRVPLPTHLQKSARQRSRNLKYLISDPERGSACKRLNMYLRWMVRNEDGIDLGLWKKVSPAQLMLPVDTHVLQVLRGLKWTKSTTANWKVVEEATRRLRAYSILDPIRYDFALCHLSMAGRSIRMYLAADESDAEE